MEAKKPREEEEKIKKSLKLKILPKQNKINNMKIYANNKRKVYLKNMYRQNAILIKRQLEKANEVYLAEKQKEIETRLKKEIEACLKEEIETRLKEENMKYLEEKEKEIVDRLAKENEKY